MYYDINDESYTAILSKKKKKEGYPLRLVGTNNSLNASLIHFDGTFANFADIPRFNVIVSSSHEIRCTIQIILNLSININY